MLFLRHIKHKYEKVMLLAIKIMPTYNKIMKLKTIYLSQLSEQNLILEFHMDKIVINKNQLKSSTVKTSEKMDIIGKTILKLSTITLNHVTNVTFEMK